MSIVAAFTLFDLIMSLLVLFGLTVFFWLLINILLDVFRDATLSGWAKALWTLAILVLPLIGLLAYLVVRGGSMHERMQQRAANQDAEARARLEGPPPSRADELAKLKQLHDDGVLTDEEFHAQKAWVLGS